MPDITVYGCAGMALVHTIPIKTISGQSPSYYILFIIVTKYSGHVAVFFFSTEYFYELFL